MDMDITTQAALLVSWHAGRSRALRKLERCERAAKTHAARCLIRSIYFQVMEMPS